MDGSGTLQGKSCTGCSDRQWVAAFVRFLYLLLCLLMRYLDKVIVVVVAEPGVAREDLD